MEIAVADMAKAGGGATEAISPFEDALFTCDRSDVIRAWSPGAERLLGYGADEIVGRPLHVLLSPRHATADANRPAVRPPALQVSLDAFETELVCKLGRPVRVSVSRATLVDERGDVRDYCWVLRQTDVTYAVLDQLYEAEKLAALRAMASGVAHEIGNPLAGVLGLLQLAERKTRESDTRERLGRARSELLRVARITRELTDFTRAEREEGAIDVNAVLHSAVVFARYAYPAAPVAVECRLDRAVPSLAGSRGHFLQACLHLLMNAYDATLGSGGSIVVSSGVEDRTVVVGIEDSGRGMAPDVEARIFEPFFTTKDAGAGTGLGLYVCRRIIVEEFSGGIAVDSQPGVGTRFRLSLPLRPARAQHTRSVPRRIAARRATSPAELP